MGKPVPVMRKTSETPEAVDTGTELLVGIDEGMMKGEVARLLTDTEAWGRMSKIRNFFCESRSAFKIVNYIYDLYN